MKRSYFKRKPISEQKPMKRTTLRKIGKIGKANIEARQKIAEVSRQHELNFCEVNLKDCLRGMYLAPAHRHKRSWYQGNAELLADFNEWVCACVNCHNQMEHNAELTEQVFKRCR